MAPSRTRTVPVGFAYPPSKRLGRYATGPSRATVLDDADADIFVPNLAALRRKVYDRIIQRLRNAQAVVTGLTVDSLSWILPNGNVDMWECFLSFPMLVSDDSLQKLMALEESTAETPAPAPGTSLFYVRSFEISCNDMRSIILSLKAASLATIATKMSTWRDVLSFAVNRETVFVRYFGMTEVNSAYARFAANLISRNYGLYGAFITALRAVSPQAIDNCKVFTFSKATTQGFRKTDGALEALHVSTTDTREQALIELFGRDSLLNQQTGGKYVAYQPCDNDVELFQRLNTQAFSRPAFQFSRRDSSITNSTEKPFFPVNLLSPLCSQGQVSVS